METRTEYALTHKTTGRWLTTRPSEGRYGESPHEADAWASEFMSVAELEHFRLAEFAPAWRIVPITRPLPLTPEEP